MINEYVKRKSRLRYLKKQNNEYVKDFISIEMKLIEKSEKKIIKNYGVSMLEDLKQLVKLHGYCVIRE